MNRSTPEFSGTAASPPRYALNIYKDKRDWATKDDNAYWYTVQIKPELLKYIVEKGSITINGISLTVAGVDKDSFCVSVIPHTRKETNLFALGVGSVVNLECDLIGKYVEQILLLKTEESPASTITEEFLRNFGF